MIMWTTAHSTSSPASRFKVLLAGLGLTFASFLAFAFPLPVLLFVAVVLGLFIAMKFPGCALYLYAASLFLIEWPSLEGMKISVPTLAGALFLTAACLRRLRSPEEATRGSWIPFMIGIISMFYLAAALLNADWTFAHPRLTITYLALFATTLAASYVLRNPGWAWRVSQIFCAGSAILSLLALYEVWTGQYNMVGVFPGQDERPYGLSDPNITAVMLVTLLPLPAAHFVCGRSTRTKILAVALMALSLVGIGMTASRGGVVGCVLTLGAISLFVGFKQKPGSCGDRPHDRLFGSALRRIGLLAVLLCSVGFAAYVAPQNLWDRLSTVEQWSNPKKEVRLQIWSYYLDRWRESPWVGKGPGYADEREKYTESTPVQTLVEVGVLGFAAFVVLNALAFWEALNASRRFALQGMTEMSALSGALAASLIGFHSTAFFLTCATHKELWFLLGFAAALSYLSRSNQGARYCAVSANSLQQTTPYTLLAREGSQLSNSPPP
jgi:hypothetical protein